MERCCGTPLALLVGLSLAVQTSNTVAQESPPRDDRQAPVEGSTGDETAWQRLIYVPYRQLQQLVNSDQHNALIVVPEKLFQQMRDRLQSLETQEARKSVNAVLTRAAYSGVVEKDVARVVADFSVRVLQAGGAALPVRFGDAAIGKLTSEGDSVLLEATGEGEYSLNFPAAGEYRLQLELTLRVRTTPDGRSLELECPPAGVTKIDLQVPGADQSIELSPKAAAAETVTDANSSRIEASLGATRRLTARWRPVASTAPVMEVLTTVRSETDVRIADGQVHTHATLTYQVLRGQLSQVQIVVPAGQRVLDVTAAGMKNWKTESDEQNQVVTVDLLGGEGKTVAVEVFTEMPLPEEGFEIGGREESGKALGVHPLGETRESGLVAVSATSDLALVVEVQQGLVRVENSELPPGLRRPEVLAWRFFNPNFRLQLSARAVEPRLQSVRTARLIVRDDEIESTENFALQIERAGVFEVRFELPPGFVVDRVDCESMKEQQVSEASNELIVSLRERVLGKLEMTVAGRRPFEAGGETSTVLPLLVPRLLARDRGEIHVFAPESLEVIADEKTVQGLIPIQSAAVAPVGEMRLASAWGFSVKPEISIRTERRKPRLTAGVATSILVRQDVVEIETLLNYLVQFAGIDTFRFAVPEALADSVQVSAVDAGQTPIQQQSREEEAKDGWVSWRVVLQRAVTGPVRLKVRYDLKPERLGIQKQADFAVSPLRVLESPGRTPEAPPVVVTAVDGEIAVRRERSISVGASAAEPVESIDLRELVLLPAEGDLAYRYFTQPNELSAAMALDLSASQLEVKDVVETVVAKAAVEAVVTEDSVVTCRCRFLLKSSERQRLSVELPSAAEPIDAIVAGKRVELERVPGGSPGKRWDVYRINVARSTSADEPFVIALVFRAPYNPRPLPGRGGMLSLSLPRLVNAVEGDNRVVVQELRTVAWVPREYALVGRPADFTPLDQTWISFRQGAMGYREETGDLDRWFGDTMTGLFAFQTSGRAYQYTRLGNSDSLVVPYWRVNWYSTWISGAIFVSGLLLTRTSWSNRFSILLLMGFALALFALQDRELVLNLIAAARYGLAAVAGWWLIHAILQPASRNAKAAPVSPSGAGPALAAEPAVTWSPPAEPRPAEIRPPEQPPSGS